MHFGAFAFFLGGTDRPPPSAAEFHLNVKGLWTPTTLVMWINGSENQLSCGTGPGRTLLLLNGVVAHLSYCDNEAGSLSAYHIPTISSFQILLERNVSPYFSTWKESVSHHLLPNIQIWRMWNPTEKNPKGACIHVEQNLPPNIWISPEFYSLPKWAGDKMTSNESEDDGDILYMPRWWSLVKKFSQIWL